MGMVQAAGTFVKTTVEKIKEFVLKVSVAMVADMLGKEIGDRAGATSAAAWTAGLSGLATPNLFAELSVSVIAVLNSLIEGVTTKQVEDHRKDDGTVSSWWSGSLEVLSSALKAIAPAWFEGAELKKSLKTSSELGSESIQACKDSDLSEDEKKAEIEKT